MGATVREKWPWLVLALVLTLAVFARGLTGELVYDDRFTVAQNPLITSLDRIPEIFASGMWDFTGPKDAPAVGYWRPLANVVLAFGWSMGGADPVSYHVLSLLLHLGATAVAFRLAWRLSKNTAVAFFSAALFGLHPLHVESVAWISAVNDPLFGLFALLAVDAWIGWRERGSTGAPWIAALWFLCGLLSKELAAAVLPIVFVFDLVSGYLVEPARRWRAWARAYAPLLIGLGIVYGGRALVFESLAAGFDRTTTGFGVGWARLLVLRLEILGGLVALATWPFELQVFPPFSPGVSFRQMVGPIVGLVGAAIAAVASGIRGTKTIFMAALFAPLALLPLLFRVETLGIFPVSGRYAYLAVFGVALFVSLVVFKALPAKVAVALLTVVTCAFGAASYTRVGIWKDEVTLLTTAARESPDSPYAHGVLGEALIEKYGRTRAVEDLAAAHAAYQRSLDLAQSAQHGNETIFAASGDFVRANVGLGWSLIAEAEVDEYHDFSTAATLFKMVTTRYPMSVEGWTGRGYSEFRNGELDSAEASLKRAIETDPRYAAAHRYLGEVYAKRGDWERAQAEFEEALRIWPENVNYLLLLAAPLEHRGRDDEAQATFERAVKIAPDDARPLVKLGILKAKRRDFEGALALFDRALRLDPNNGEAWLQRGRSYAARGENTSALQAFQRASDLVTDSFDAHYNAGALLLAAGQTSAAVPYLTRAYENRPDNPTGKLLREKLLLMPIQSVDALLDLATTDAARKEFDGALEWIARAQALRPDDGRAHFVKGGMLRQKGDTAGAIAELKKAAQAMPDSLMAHQACGSLMAEVGDRTGAIDYFERALAIAKKIEGQSAETRTAIETLRAKIEELKHASK